MTSMARQKKEKITPLETYILDKIHMMQTEFRMKLTESEIKHMKSLKSEIQVDNYAHDLFMKKL
jgi:hypothetical protein